MLARWSSGPDAASNALTARRASTSAGRTFGRNTVLERLGLTVAVALHATGPGSGGGGAGGGRGGGGSATPGGADAAAGGGEGAPTGAGGASPSARDADRRWLARRPSSSVIRPNTASSGATLPTATPNRPSQCSGVTPGLT